MRKMRASVKIFSQPFKALRERLGTIADDRVSQDEMAKKVGCTLAGYRKWEAGTAIPRGDWMLKIIALCPDPESLSKFFIDIQNDDGVISAAIGSVPNVKRQSKALTSTKSIADRIAEGVDPRDRPHAPIPRRGSEP